MQHQILNFIHEKIWLISLDIQNILATFILVGLAVTSGASNIKADEFLVLFFLIPLATMISLVFPPLMFFLITKYQWYHPFKLSSIGLFFIGIIMTCFTIVVYFMKIINKI